jgi:hypothetical protein
VTMFSSGQPLKILARHGNCTLICCFSEWIASKLD